MKRTPRFQLVQKEVCESVRVWVCVCVCVCVCERERERERARERERERDKDWPLLYRLSPAAVASENGLCYKEAQSLLFAARKVKVNQGSSSSQRNLMK